MNQPKQPQDHRPKFGPAAVRTAVSLQAANLVQKAMLDNLSTKVIMVLRVVKPMSEARTAQPIVVREIADILAMDRNAIHEARASFRYDDDRIQAIIDKAVEDVTAAILEDDGK